MIYHNFIEKKKLLPATARVLFAAVALVTLFSRFLAKAPFLSFYVDDFFYYLKIAHNLANHKISSFDGIHLTNGYHPLWMAALTGLSILFHGKAFFLALQCLTFAAACTFFEGVKKVLSLLGIAEPLLSVLALIPSLQALLLLRDGMEVTLALPLCIWLVAAVLAQDNSPRQGLGIGLLASLTILSRLDTIFLVVLLLAACLYSMPKQRRLRWLGGFCAGITPVALYFAFNFFYFHSMMPLSGRAKQLKPGWMPSLVPLSSLISPHTRTKLILVPASLLLLTLAIVCAVRFYRCAPTKERVILSAVLLFPLVQLLTLSFVSDWPLWPWYFYPLVLSSAPSLALFAVYIPASNLIQQWLLMPVALLYEGVLGLFLVAYSILGSPAAGTYKVSQQIAGMMDANPGVYAMGDKAGAIGYLSHQPLIQLEGLVMDGPYLKKIQDREPLRSILKDYGASYYVTMFARTPSPEDCLSVREPAQAGPSSPISTGKICSSPIAAVYDQTYSVYVAIFPADSVK